MLVAAVLEAAIALVSDLTDRWRLACLGQAALAASLLLLACAPSRWGLVIGLAVAGTASGVACGAIQALLVASDPHAADHTMLRWTVFGAVGDALAPLITGAAVAVGYSYRGAMLAVALAATAQGVALLRVGRTAAGCVRGPSAEWQPRAEPIRAALARAARCPRLWAWLLAAACCTFLDEIVVALAALRMQRDQGLTEGWAVAATVTLSIGSVAGAAACDRAVAHLGPHAILVGSSVLCAVSLASACATESAVASCVALLVVGATCAPHHALTQARAYAQLPGNPGTVQAIARLFVAVDVVAPIAVGLVADRFGLRAALVALGVQPLVVGLCAGCEALLDRRLGRELPRAGRAG